MENKLEDEYSKQLEKDFVIEDEPFRVSNIEIKKDNKKIYKTRKFIIFNVVGIVLILFSFWGSKSFGSALGKTKNWVEVKTTIDDLDFASDGSEVDSDGKTIYKFHVNRVLSFTLDGKDIKVFDKQFYTSEDENYSPELKKGYTDDGVYRVDPKNPYNFTLTYGDSEITNMTSMLRAVAIVLLIGLLVADFYMIIVMK